MRDPFQGIGKPEPLKFLGSGVWSRPITQEHRLVYVAGPVIKQYSFSAVDTNLFWSVATAIFFNYFYHLALEPWLLKTDAFTLALYKELASFLQFNNCNHPAFATIGFTRASTV